jgi:hypothetical protein
VHYAKSHRPFSCAKFGSYEIRIELSILSELSSRKAAKTW